MSDFVSNAGPSWISFDSRAGMGVWTAWEIFGSYSYWENVVLLPDFTTGISIGSASQGDSFAALSLYNSLKAFPEFLGLWIYSAGAFISEPLLEIIS